MHLHKFVCNTEFFVGRPVQCVAAGPKHLNSMLSSVYPVLNSHNGRCVVEWRRNMNDID